MNEPEEGADSAGGDRGRGAGRGEVFLLGGRRKSARRDDDKKQFIYVDQYRPWLLVAIMLLAILSLSDACLPST